MTPHALLCLLLLISSAPLGHLLSSVASGPQLLQTDNLGRWAWPAHSLKRFMTTYGRGTSTATMPCAKELRNIAEAVGRSSLPWVMLQPNENQLTVNRWIAVNVTLDQGTANPLLTLSKDLKSVIKGDKMQYWPDNPEQFEIMSCVLGCEGFTSGKHSWEVEIDVKEEHVVGGLGWAVGIARKSVRRKGLVYACPREGIWVVGKVMPYGFLAFTSPEDNLLILRHEPKKIQISLDYKKGQVNFFDADSGASIFTFPSASFSGEKLYPYFRMEWVGRLKCCHTPLGPHESRRAPPDPGCSELQVSSRRPVQRGSTPQAMSPTRSADLLRATQQPPCTGFTESREQESPNTVDFVQHPGSVRHEQSIPHSAGCVGVKPAAEAPRAQKRWEDEEEAEESPPLNIKDTSSLGAGGNTQPKRAEDEGGAGAEPVAAMARELHPKNDVVPLFRLGGSSGEKWEGMLIQANTGHEEKGRGGSLKEARESASCKEKNSWLSSENHLLFALIPFLSILIIVIYDLLT